MPTLNIEIARTGTFTTATGQPVSLTRDVLAQIAANYDAERNPAPLVLGHPEMDDPAWGWATKLTLGADDVLRAEADDVAPEFAEGVSQGRYRKVSMAAFPPKHPSNPAPGEWYLKHIGFLGARPPAIPGLKPVTLAADPHDVIVEFGEMSSWGLSRVLRSLREWFIAKHDLATADQVVPDWVVTEAEMSARTEKTANPLPGIALAAPSIEEHSMTEAQLKAREDAIIATEKKLAAERAALDQQAARLAAQTIELATQDATDFVEAQVAAGRVLPRHQAGLVTLLCSLDDAQTVTFAAADGKPESVGARTFMRDLIESLPKQVDYSEHTKQGVRTGGTASFAAPDGALVDPDGLKLHQAAKAYQAAHPNVSFMDALAAVS